jgi:DNA-binding NarL/FixJ family response regulator
MGEEYEPTKRQRQALDLLLHEGMTNDQIATELDISISAVEGHMQRLFEATGHRGRVALALWWSRRGGLG